MILLIPVFVFFLIASAFSINKIILCSISPNFFVTLRMGISGILLILFFCKEKKIWIKAKENLKSLILISFFTTLVPSILRAYAIKSISSSRASFWGSFEPFITAIYMYFMFNEKLNFNKFLGCALGFFGAIFFIFTNLHETPTKIKIFFCLADFFQIMSIVLSRYGWIKAKIILNKENSNFSPQQLNAFTFTISSIFSLIITMIFNGYAGFIINYSWNLLFYMLYTIIVGNMIAYTLYGYLLKKYNITFISLAGLSTPLFVHLLGPILLNEPISLYFFIALGFLFLALYFFNKK